MVSASSFCCCTTAVDGKPGALSGEEDSRSANESAQRYRWLTELTSSPEVLDSSRAICRAEREMNGVLTTTKIYTHLDLVPRDVVHDLLFSSLSEFLLILFYQLAGRRRISTKLNPPIRLYVFCCFVPL